MPTNELEVASEDSQDVSAMLLGLSRIENDCKMSTGASGMEAYYSFHSITMYGLGRSCEQKSHHDHDGMV